MDTGILVKNRFTVLTRAFPTGPVYSVFILLAIFVKCFYYQFTTRISVRPFFSADNLIMMLATICMLMVSMGLIIICLNKKRYLSLCVLHLFLSALLITDTNFYRYYYTIISAPVLFHVDIRLLSSVDQSIMSLFKIKDIIYLIDIPFVIAGAVILGKGGPESIRFRKRALLAAVLIFAGILTFIPLYIRADIESYFYNSSYVAKSLGVLYAHVDGTTKNIKDLFRPKALTKAEQKKIADFYASREEPVASRYQGVAKGRNLIVIQVEALQQFVLDRKVGGNEITPNLNKLIKNNVYFDNFYFQVSAGNTSDAELLSNTSMYPAREGAAYYRFPENSFHTLPQAMKALGYDTYALHAFSGEFWNRNQMYKAIGFDKFINSNDYKMDEFMGWKGQALSDASFFRQSLGKIDTSKPFYSFLITLSTHHPFTAFENYSFDTGSYEKTYLGNFFKAANYADKCLGEFLNELKRKGLYDNSLIVIYGDHSAVPKHQASELMGYLGEKYSDITWLKLQKVPLIICTPGIQAEKISIAGGEVDIFPTVANLIGVDASYALGKDLLNSKQGYAILRDGSIVTDDYIYLNSRRELYGTKTWSKIPISEYKPNISKLLEDIQISDIIMEKDAFKQYK